MAIFTPETLPETFTLDDLAHLTPAERAAVEADLKDEPEPEAPTEPEAPAKSEAELMAEAEAEGDPKDAPAPEAAPKEEPKAEEPAPAPEPEAQPEQPQAEPAPAQTPTYDLNALQQQAQTLADKLKKLDTDYDDGEIGFEEAQRQRAELVDQMADTRADLKLAQREQEAAAKQADDAWFAQVGVFLSKHPALQGKDNLALFDKELRTIEQEYPSLPDGGKISLAYERYVPLARAAGLTVDEVQTEPAPKPAPKQEKKPVAQQPEIPPTLAGVSAAAGNGAADGKFAALDDLMSQGRVHEAEEALARLSPAQQEEYLGSI